MNKAQFALQICNISFKKGYIFRANQHSNITTRDSLTNLNNRKENTAESD